MPDGLVSGMCTSPRQATIVRIVPAELSPKLWR